MNNIEASCNDLLDIRWKIRGLNQRDNTVFKSRQQFAMRKVFNMRVLTVIGG